MHELVTNPFSYFVGKFREQYNAGEVGKKHLRTLTRQWKPTGRRKIEENNRNLRRRKRVIQEAEKKTRKVCRLEISSVLEVTNNYQILHHTE